LAIEPGTSKIPNSNTISINDETHRRRRRKGGADEHAEKQAEDATDKNEKGTGKEMGGGKIRNR